MTPHLYENIEQCSGCSACQQACPKKCISMIPDKEGFLYPSVETNLCTGCGACERTCHMKLSNERLPLKTYATFTSDVMIREQSSSGGLFSIIALSVIRSGGVVFGARFNDDWQVVIDYVDKENDLHKLRGSKYVQAMIGDSYIKTKEFLRKGIPVLFSGTPCQIAGLRQFLHHDYDTLTLVEVVCHGVPSNGVWQAYLDDATKYANKRKISRIVSYHYRNPYMQAFLKNLTLRPSCYHCQSKKGRSGADLAMADFWGVLDICPDFFDDGGTTLALVYTERGKTLLHSLQLTLQEVPYEKILIHNPNIEYSSTPHPLRNSFFSGLEHGENFVSLVNNAFKPTVKRRIKTCIGNIMIMLKLKPPRDNIQTKEYSATFPSTGISKNDIRHINFRAKPSGWINYCIDIKWEKR